MLFFSLFLLHFKKKKETSYIELSANTRRKIWKGDVALTLMTNKKKRMKETK